MQGLTRRQFLWSSAAAGFALNLRGLSLLSPSEAHAATAAIGYADWRDVYRSRWRWDRVVRGTHTNVNCVSSCAWNLYVRDGIVWREEQSSPYVASNASVPDWNPRGCNKGACASDCGRRPANRRSRWQPWRRAPPAG